MYAMGDILAQEQRRVVAKLDGSAWFTNHSPSEVHRMI
jgi:hypothetical protein